MATNKHDFWAENLRDIILGGQDGLVNVLGVTLGVAAATQDTRIILVAGLAATFAESVSMAAVGYTAIKAERDYLIRKQREGKIDAKEVEIDIKDTKMSDPAASALVIGTAAIIGSFIPLLPFFWLPVASAFWLSIGISAATLFIVGAIKAKLTVGEWYKSGFEMMMIGMLAAFVGYLVGKIFQV